MPSCLNHIDVMQGLNRCTRCGKTFCGDCLVELKGGFFCAPCKSEQVKDIQSGVDIAELPLAGIGARLAAQFVDGLVLALVWVPIAFASGLFAFTGVTDPVAMQSKIRILSIMVTGIFLVYEGIMLQLRGQTLGKMALKIKVVTADGNDLASWQAWVRPLVRVVIALVPYTAIVDYIPSFFTKGKTCIHDMAARTRVVKLNR